MEKERVITVAKAVHKLQLALLDGIKDENKLFAAGSLMSRNDYNDVVTERSYSNLCGYPLCANELPVEKPKRGNYRISLKEHKVYDLRETVKYCGSSCLISSQAFAGSLEEERCAVLNVGKLNEVVGLFEGLGLGGEGDGKRGETRGEKLRIEEKAAVKGGEVSMEEWIGPSNAIEGYVPQRDRKLKASNKGSEVSDGKSSKQNEMDFEIAVAPSESKGSSGKERGKGKPSTSQSKASEAFFNDMDFTSTIIFNDEYTVSKKTNGDSRPVVSSASKEGSKPKKSVSNKGNDLGFGSLDFMSTIITQEDEYSVSKLPPSEAIISDPNQMFVDFAQKLDLDDEKKHVRKPQSSDVAANGCLVDAALSSAGMFSGQNVANSSRVPLNGEFATEEAVHSCLNKVKSSLRTSGSKKEARSVTWADNKDNDGGNLCEFSEFKGSKEGSKISSNEMEIDDDSERFVTAEACAIALTQAAEAIASGQADVNDAFSDAGIRVLPRSEEADKAEYVAEDDNFKDDSTAVKWPDKQDNSKPDVFESEESWFDAPPDGFSLTLPPFANMWNGLFSWMTSSSLAYIYGGDENSHEQYMSVNGREYPGKTVLADGRSLEIKQTLAGCLGRALPGVVATLKIPIPVSTLEQGLACLLGTMSFIDALPPLRMKQWQVVVLLFIDALSICRIPGLAPYLTSRRAYIPKVLDGAQISAEEYEIMKDLVIPLGRVPQFAMQSGG